MKKGLFIAALFFTFHLSPFTSLLAQRVVADDWKQLTVEFTVDGVRVGETSLCGSLFSTLSFDGSQELLDGYGTPSLPVLSRLIEVPVSAEFDVVVSDAEYDTLAPLPHLLMPVQAPRSKSDTTAQKLWMNREVYSQNVFVGLPKATVEAVGIARDRRLARLQFAPLTYNPVSGQVVVCRKATVTVTYRGGDEQASKELFERYHSPAFNNGANPLNALYSSLITHHSLTPKAVRAAAPVRYLIVSHSMFRGQLDEFVQWKRRKGFRVDVAYTDDPAVGSDTTSIQTYIRSQYENASLANPAPTYVLLVGDVEQIPSFNYRAAVNETDPSSHITDLYYMTWTVGDHIPDCHYGRFSAQSLSQLLPQIQKTLMYEQYTFADPSFLDRAVMVAGVDRGVAGDNGYNYADPTMDYAVTHYVNGTQGWANVYYFKNDVSIVPSCTTNVTISSSASGNSSTVRSYYSLGAGLINYTAHGGPTGWGTPSFGNSHVSQMTNHQKFGLMIGNCCQTNMFGETTCFGEALLRRGEYAGAVGYIGGSDYTYWGQDFYWAVGVRSGIGPNMSMNYNASNLGVYDRTFHTHGEAYPQWCTTQGSMVMQGDMAVEASTSSAGMKWYYWEIYHLMGDPSLMPYMTQADTMSVAVAPTVEYGATSMTVMAVPNAYVALVDTSMDNLVAAVFADASGSAMLTLPANLAVGEYLLAVSAQQYRTAFLPVRVQQPDGAYPVVTSILSDPLNAGDSVVLTLHIVNNGNQMARNIVTQLASNSPLLTLMSNTVTLDSLAPGASQDVAAVTAVVSPETPDNTFVDLSVSTSWTGGTLTASNVIRKWLYAPSLELTVEPATPTLMPGANLTATATMRNRGHAPTGVRTLSFTSPSSLFSVTPEAFSFALEPFSDTTLTLTLHADGQLVQGITVPVSYSYGAFTGTVPAYIGPAYMETFEGGDLHLAGWSTSSSNPWVIIDSLAWQGTYCLRSSPTLTHYESSEITYTTVVAEDDSVSFYYSISSEGNYDKFFFLIDDVEMLVTSGELGWRQVGFPLTAGTHILTFRYTKDGSVSKGSDCVWIDNVVMPHPSRRVLFDTRSVCQGDELVINGQPIACDETGSGVSCYTAENGDFVVVDYSIHPTYSDTVSAHTSANSYYWYGTPYTESGTYTHVMYTAEGCDSAMVLVLTFDSVVGIGDVDGEELKVAVYPNPTTGRVHLSRQVDEVRVYDVAGREVMHVGPAEVLDLGDLPRGTYLLRLVTADATCERRIVKQ